MDVQFPLQGDWDDFELQLGKDSRPAEPDRQQRAMRNRRFEPTPRKRAASNGIHRRRNKRIDW